MSIGTMARWRAALNLKLLNDNTRATLLAGIAKVAPQSPLVQIPAIAASLAALTTKGATLATNVTAAAQSEKLYVASTGARDVSRVTFDLELDTLKTLVENNATSAGDVTGMGFLLLILAKASQAQPDPPEALVVQFNKTRGKATVTVQGKGYLGSFAAQQSPDPPGPTTWSDMPGRGKQRKLAGYASGAKVWVRFAAVRFGLQSAWSAPVLVTFP